MTHTITITEEQRQLLLLALAQLSLERPGWHPIALTELAQRVPGGLEMYEGFREINADMPRCETCGAMKRTWPRATITDDVN